MSIPGAASPLFLATTAGAADAFSVAKSLRFNSGDSAYLNFQPSAAGNRRTWTWSGWLKRSNLDKDNYFLASRDGTSYPNVSFRVRSSDVFYFLDQTSSTDNINLSSVALFRDPSAWYHFVVSVNTTEATASDRVKVYANGVQIDLTGTYPSQNFDCSINNNVQHTVGRRTKNNGSFDYGSGYLAEVNFIDGQALAPTDFGETDASGVWQAKEFTGTYSSGTRVYSNEVTGASYSGYSPANAFDGSTSSNAVAAAGATQTFSPSPAIPVSSSLRVFVNKNGSGGTFTVNGVSYASNTTEPGSWVTISGVSSLTSVVWGTSGFNMQRVAAIEVDGTILTDPTGLNSFRLPFTDNSSTEALGYDQKETITLNPKGGMDVVTYTGNGGTQSIGGLAFQPDLVWIKDRTNTGFHSLFDTVRGATKTIFSNATNAEETQSGGVTAFNSDGFSLGSWSIVNAARTYVAWCWKAGGAAVSNTDGSITSQVSASTDYGFSVVTYSGSSSNAGGTVGHGLGNTPDLIFCKSRTATNGWVTYTKITGKDKYLLLHSDGAAQTSSGVWGSSDPTTTVFGTDSSHPSGNNDGDIVAYCWSEVAGFSKFSSYSGNGSATGPVVTTGFKPKFLLIKRSDSSGPWYLYDSARDSSNPIDKLLQAESSVAEFTTGANSVDFLSNGFQLKGTGGDTNASGGTYFYAAYADRPGNNWTPNNLSAGIDLNPTAKQNFDVVTYTGNGGTQSISSLAFQPDFVWIKNRDDGGLAHFLFDSVRGATKALSSNLINAESTQSDALTSFNNNGFSVGAKHNVNENNNDIVAWCWKAGGAAVSNTNGSINSSVSVNANYGFSVSTYTGNGTAGATIGHGLSSAPKLIITKCRSNAENWRVYTETTGNTKSLFISTNEVPNSSANYWNSTSPTSSVFSVGNDTGANGNGYTYVAYAWSEVDGFSKFGSYTGAANLKITTGFRPRFVLIKCTTDAFNWVIVDGARGNSSNGVSKKLYPNSSTNEDNDSRGSETKINFLDDGFQFADQGAETNTGSRTYIYAAFAGTIPGDPDIDSLVDSPSNGTQDDTGIGGEVTGCYATLNPLANGPNQTLSNGNLELATSSSSLRGSVLGTIGVSSGKWYYEMTVGSNVRGAVGWAIGTPDLSIGPGIQSGTYVYNFNSQKLSGNVGGSYGSAWSSGDVIGVELDLDAGTLSYQQNGTSLGTAYSGLSGTFLPITGDASSGGTFDGSFNFGQRAFAHPVSGYKSLNSASLPTPTIADGSQYFDVALWTGNNSTQSLTGFQFGPDLFWSKSRSTTWNNGIHDIVRGPNKLLRVDTTGTEYTAASPNESITSFNPDGVTFGADGAAATVNYSGTYVGWAWDAGANSNKTYTVTVSGGKFYIDGVQQPTLTLAEGSTYKFDQSASTNSSHPLRFSTTSDGTHGGGSEYTTGVTTAGTPGSAGAFTQIVIAATAPTLYAYCTNHSGMGFQVNTSDKGGFTIPVGGLNSSTYDQSQTWSSGIAGNYPSSGNNAYTDMFNGVYLPGDGGNNRNGIIANQNSGSYTWTTSSFPNAKSVEIYYFAYNPPSTALEVNGNSVSVSNQVVTSVTVDVTGSGLTSVKGFSGSDWTTSYLIVKAVIVDGLVLVDSSVSVTNVPSIASQVMASPESGFSIATYTGNGTINSTIGHGLNAAPEFIIVKNRSNSYAWAVLHTSVGTTGTTLDGSPEYYMLQLDSSAARNNFTNDNIWNPTSSTFKINGEGTGSWVNASGDDYLALCFAPVEGYSSIGSYVGNGNTDGVFVYTGFRPRWLLLKNTTGQEWFIFDTARDPINVAGFRLTADLSVAENTTNMSVLDFLSNGFKIRNTNEAFNGNNQTFVYIAFAENPFASNGGLAR